jgi:hypothetical protein
VRVLPAVLLALHGLAHLPGFLGPWRLVARADLPYATYGLAGRVHLGAAGARALGVMWLLTALAFWVAADLFILGRAGWVPLTLGASTVSLALCATSLPETRAGLVLDAVLLALLLLLGPGLGWV